jgi:hypothetical protein
VSNLSYEDAVRVWAAKRLDIDFVLIDRVAIEADSGWAGTDVTPGDWPTCVVSAYLTDGSSREVDDLFADGDGSTRTMYSGRKWDFVDLLNEILGVSA